MSSAYRQTRPFWSAVLLGLIVLSLSSAIASAQAFRSAPDLAVKVVPPPNGCALGQPCRVGVTVFNRGKRPFNGVINMLQTVRPKRATFEAGRQSGWVCRAQGARAGCTQTTGRIRPGASSNFSLTLIMPRNTVRKRANFCAEIDWRAPGAMTGRNRMMQAILARRGFRMDPPDGVIGPQTRAAIGQFQLQNRLPITGVPNKRTMRALVGRWGVGDGNAKNDRNCAKIRLVRRGTATPEIFTPPPTPAPAAPPKNPVVQKPVKKAPVPTLTCGRNKIAKNGTCGCKPGYREMPDKSCVQSGDSPARPVITTPPRCTGGKFRSVRGECVCPAGREDVAGTCRKKAITKPAIAPTPTPVPTPAPAIEPAPVPEKQPAPKPEPAPEPEKIEPPKAPEAPVKKPQTKKKSCPGSQIVGKDGTCGCYLNLKGKDGKCLVKVRKDCLPGQIINIRGKCECPKGETIRNGQCDKL